MRVGDAVDRTKQMIMEKEKIELCDGERIHCVIITADNKRICFASGKQVAVHDVHSGRREYIITETCRVVSICTRCNHPHKLLVYLMNGMRVEHDLDTNTVIECRDLHHRPLLGAFQGDRGSDIVYVVCGDEQLENISVNRLNVEDAHVKNAEKLIKNDSFKIPKINTLQQLALCDKFLAVCEGLWVRAYIFESGATKQYKFTGKEELSGVRSCFVAVKAFRDVSLVATLSFGRVLVWDNAIECWGTPSQCVHWHRLAPSVALTPQGAIVSGGVEGTIVKYAARGSRTGSTADSFLSRLGTAIDQVNISEDGSLLVVVLIDRSVVTVLLSTMAVYSRLETLQRPLTGAGRLALAIDPLMPHLVVHNGRPGCIQWINPCTMLTTAVLDVVSQNLPKVIRTEPLLLAPHTDVSAVALSKTTIITAEERVGDEIGVNVLKFWRRNAERMASIEFSIMCESSIRYARSFDAYDDLFVSIDAAGKLIVWERHVQEDELVMWVPVRSANWKGLHVSAASQICSSRLGTIHEWGDGSKKTTLVVWRLVRGRRIRELIHYDTDNKLHAVEWCAAPQQHILLACSDTEIFALDTCAVRFKWCALQRGLMLGVCPGSPIAYDDGQLIVFDGESGIEKRSLELRDKATSVMGTCANNQSSLFIAHPKSYVSFVRQDLPSIMTNEDKLKSDSRTPFARLSDKRRVDANSSRRSAAVGRVTLEGNAALDLLKGPSHSIAPVRKIAPSFIESCLLPTLPNVGTE
ncbi:WD repeat-containing protein 75 [Toxocara canis]|uniref:WD repeat-containing protein 75 n=1 Tax=Toxocara canis TaxID=6265 RepID=A0A0B2V195_TOXCA|nr:WD repeat-containing protein 75 [Toxocara canis]